MNCAFVLLIFVFIILLFTFDKLIFERSDTKVKKFVGKCFLEFVESSQLPKYDQWRGEPYRWKVWSIQHKKEKALHDEKTGQKIGIDKQWYEIICMSLCNALISSGSETDTCDSNHIFRIKLSNEEYKQILNKTLSEEIVMQKLNECIMETNGSFYC